LRVAVVYQNLRNPAIICLPTPAFSCKISLLKSLTEHLWFEVPTRRGFLNITPKVEELVHRSSVVEGLCLVNAMHITASVFINDDESGLHQDYEVWLEKLAPHAPASAYCHNRTGEDNADAHPPLFSVSDFSSQLFSQCLLRRIDGRRRKRVLVKIIAE